jgi:hypothetical protein
VPNVNYCGVYDTNGREKLANGLNRRIVGYFTSWRTGAGNTPSYLVPNIPWDKVTHINYAFASVGTDAKVQLASGANNPDTGLTWPNIPAAAMDPSLPYKGHFQPAVAIQEALPWRESDAVGRWLGRQRRLLWRYHQHGWLGEHRRHQHPWPIPWSRCCASTPSSMVSTSTTSIRPPTMKQAIRSTSRPANRASPV